MNSAHLHLLVNHFPIILPIIGTMIMVIGLIARSADVKRIAYLLFVLGAFGAIAAMTTGEGAEDIVEGLGGDAERYIERHEESAETFAIISYILGGLSLLGLWASFTKKSFSRILAGVTVAVGFASLYFAQQAGTSGGEIRHTEIRKETTQTVPAPSAPSVRNPAGESEDDD